MLVAKGCREEGMWNYGLMAGEFQFGEKKTFWTVARHPCLYITLLNCVLEMFKMVNLISRYNFLFMSKLTCLQIYIMLRFT